MKMPGRRNAPTSLYAYPHVGCVRATRMGNNKGFHHESVTAHSFTRVSCVVKKMAIHDGSEQIVRCLTV